MSTRLRKDDGTFVDTNEFDNGYKIYKVLLNQTGTNAPVATILINTLGGTPVWSRTSPGIYTVTLNGAFPAGKTAVTCDQNFGWHEVSTFQGRNDNNSCFLNLREVATYVDNAYLADTVFTIMVYN